MSFRTFIQRYCLLYSVHLISATISSSFSCCSCLFVSFQVYLIKSSDPLSQMKLAWEGESQVHCIVEHHRGHLYLFTDAAREGVPVDSHYLMQSAVESPGPKSWKVLNKLPAMLCCFLNPCFLDIHLQFLCRYVSSSKKNIVVLLIFFW